ncbi:hypothetical protein [Colwellia sp. 12G3]|uniref:hypothetical protein n=1 Tax=Colwellia sp. 12G3 TaxID=2058299 RepID=UPI000C33755A|nr:hypothetical protein [Colwellia sp. 12G3]PKI17344.1 hypothetical protein CXF71_05065 [Colwellia sp. 12G3]
MDEFWVDNTADAPVSDSNLLTAANTGHGGGENALWLSLAGHVFAGTKTTLLGGTNLAGFPIGAGALDVTGGIAMGNIDTTSILLPNDTSLV